MDIEYNTKKKRTEKLRNALVNWTTPFLSVGHAPRSQVSDCTVRGNGGRRPFRRPSVAGFSLIKCGAGTGCPIKGASYHEKRRWNEGIRGYTPA
jgi:hypothetical protein